MTRSEASRIAYVVTRFPGTLAALSAAVEAALPHLPASEIRDVLELGAGPGPSVWALLPLFPTLARVRLVDADARMLAIARDLATTGGVSAELTLETETADLGRLDPPEPADLVVFSYALGELAETDRARAVEVAWEASRIALVVVEPGTSAGFARVRDARSKLTARGAEVLAPCPHGEACPMAAPDWCHFAARVQRSRLHRLLKHGSLGYEDEKFSYLVVGRRAAQRGDAYPSRVIARPQVRSGLVRLGLCTAAGLRHETVSRHQGQRYRTARHASWGDSWED